jgi:hypothetical protein
VPRITGKSALGAVRVKVTSLGPVAVTDSIWSASTLALDAVAASLCRIIENTTSAGVSGLPSWKRTSLRSLIVQVTASFVAIDSASSICGASLSSIVVRQL